MTLKEIPKRSILTLLLDAFAHLCQPIKMPLAATPRILSGRRCHERRSRSTTFLSSSSSAAAAIDFVDQKILQFSQKLQQTLSEEQICVLKYPDSLNGLLEKMSAFNRHVNCRLAFLSFLSFASVWVVYLFVVEQFATFRHSDATFNDVSKMWEEKRNWTKLKNYQEKIDKIFFQLSM